LRTAVTARSKERGEKERGAKAHEARSVPQGPTTVARPNVHSATGLVRGSGLFSTGSVIDVDETRSSLQMNVFLQLRALPRIVRVLFAATLVNRCGTMVLPYLALYITQGLGLDAETAGTVLAVYGGGAIVTPVVAGRLSDRYGAPHIMRGSLVLSGIILLGYPFMNGVSGLVALTLALSFVAEAFRPASLAVVSNAVPAQQRKTAFVVIRFAINLGMSIGPAVGGLLAGVSFHALFYIDGATSIAAGALLTFARFDDAKKASAPDTAPSAEGVAALPGPPPAAPALAASLPAPRRTFAVFLLGAFLLALAFFQFESSLPLYVVRDVGASEAFYGALITINAVIIIFAEIPLNLKMDAWPHARSMALGALFTAVGFGLLGFGANVPLVVASVPIWTIGEMIVLPATSAFVADLAPAGRSGLYLGLYGTAFGLGFALGPYIGIYALEHFGGRVLWGGTFVAGGLAALLFACLPCAKAPRLAAAKP
jgi:MFS family permease